MAAQVAEQQDLVYQLRLQYERETQSAAELERQRQELDQKTGVSIASERAQLEELKKSLEVTRAQIVEYKQLLSKLQAEKEAAVREAQERYLRETKLLESKALAKRPILFVESAAPHPTSSLSSSSSSSSSSSPFISSPFQTPP
jgi:hypothetical protein